MNQQRNEWDIIFPSKEWRENIVKRQMGTEWETASCNSYLYRVQRANKASFSAHAAFHSSFIVDITRQASSFAIHFLARLSSSASTVGAALFRRSFVPFQAQACVLASVADVLCPFQKDWFYPSLRNHIPLFYFSHCRSSNKRIRELRSRYRHSSSLQRHSSHNDGLIVASIFAEDETMKVKFHYSEDKFPSKQLRDKFSELDGDCWWPSGLRQWSWKIKREMLCDILLAIINFIVWHRELLQAPKNRQQRRGVWAKEKS